MAPPRQHPRPADSQEALEANLFWDGVLPLAPTIVLVIGLVLLWRGWEQRGRATGNLATAGGLTLTGWGGSPGVDQMVCHELLDLHDVREGVDDVARYNRGFLAIGLVLAATGWWLLRTRGASAPPSASVADGRVRSAPIGSAVRRPRTVRRPARVRR